VGASGSDGPDDNSLIGYRIVLSFLLIYVIPMTTLVALNGRILAAMWHASRGPASSDQPQNGAGSSHRCSRHQLSNCSMCAADTIAVELSDPRQHRPVSSIAKRTVNKYAVGHKT